MKKKNTSAWGAIGLGVIFLLGKLKWVLVLFKLLKLKTLISMGIFLGTYALFYGWKFAVALVYLLFVHEMGHLFAAKKIKLPTTPAIFIPFMGAAIGMKERPKSAKEEGFLAYMGPVFGLLSFLPAIPLYLFTEEPFWALVIVIGSMINLFNLIPMSPLDGGRIVAGISTKLWGFGILLLLGFAIWNKSVIAFLILILGIIQWVSIYKEQKNIGEKKKEIKEYEDILVTLKGIAETSSYEHLNYFAQSLKPTLKEESLKESLFLLKETEIEEERDANKKSFMDTFEKEVIRLKLKAEQVASYYKTDTKTKVQLLLVYVGLVIALGTSFYLSYDLLPVLQK